jgi:hypothetical protein
MDGFTIALFESAGNDERQTRTFMGGGVYGKHNFHQNII